MGGEPRLIGSRPPRPRWAGAGLLVALWALPGPAGAQRLAPPGALACAGCHGPVRAGSPVPPIHGRSAAEIVAAMQDYRAGRRSATVMDRIAKGFSDDEVEAMAAWLAAEPPN